MHYPADNEGEEVTPRTFTAVYAVCAVPLYARDSADIKVISRGKIMSR